MKLAKLVITITELLTTILDILYGGKTGKFTTFRNKLQNFHVMRVCSLLDIVSGQIK